MRCGAARPAPPARPVAHPHGLSYQESSVGRAGEGFPKASDLCSGDLPFLQLCTATHGSVPELLTRTEGEQAAAEHRGAASGAVGDVRPLLGGKAPSSLLRSTSVSAPHPAALQAVPLGWEGSSPPAWPPLIQQLQHTGCRCCCPCSFPEN